MLHLQHVVLPPRNSLEKISIKGPFTYLFWSFRPYHTVINKSRKCLDLQIHDNSEKHILLMKTMCYGQKYNKNSVSGP